MSGWCHGACDGLGVVQVELEEHHESHVVPPHRVGTTGVGTQPEDLMLLAPPGAEDAAINRAVDQAATAEEAEGAPRGIVEQAKNTARRVLQGILHPAQGDVEGGPLAFSAWKRENLTQI